MIMSLKQKNIKFKPRIKLNHNKYTNNISYICTCTTEWRSKGGGARDGAVVRAVASHQCGPGSNPGIDAICGLSLLLVLSFAPKSFSSGTFPNYNSTRNQVDEEPLCGCATSKTLFILFYSFKNLNAKKIISV